MKRRTLQVISRVSQDMANLRRVSRVMVNSHRQVTVNHRQANQVTLSSHLPVTHLNRAIRPLKGNLSIRLQRPVTHRPHHPKRNPRHLRSRHRVVSLVFPERLRRVRAAALLRRSIRRPPASSRA